MFCEYVHCEWHNKPVTEADKNIIKFQPCDYCAEAFYHSEFCKKVRPPQKNHAKAIIGRLEKVSLRKMQTDQKVPPEPRSTTFDGRRQSREIPKAPLRRHLSWQGRIRLRDQSQAEILWANFRNEGH
jgi:hypothetical protein